MPPRYSKSYLRWRLFTKTIRSLQHPYVEGEKNADDGDVSVTTHHVHFLGVLRIRCFDLMAAKAEVYDINIVISIEARIDDKLFGHKFYLKLFI